MSELIERVRDALADRYRLERELGQGGMATVYLAHDLRHDRQVAIKILRPDLAAAVGAERFLAEIRVTASLQHPNILPLFDSGQAEGPGGFLYYVMPVVEGESLRARLDRERQLPVADAVRIAAEVARAVDYAHRRGVIHRDIKPENILLHDGRALVADFGIARALTRAAGPRLTDTGLSVGTPHYMSPEQAAADRDVDARTDVYALGCVLYEMLAGEPPHTGPTAHAVIGRVMTEPPRPLRDARPSTPPHVAAAVERALAKLPADRWDSARAFADALEGGQGAVAVPVPAAAPAAGWLRDWRSRVALGVATVAVAAGVVTVTRGKPGRAPTAPAGRFAIALSPEAGIAFAAVQSPIALSRDGALMAYASVTRDSVEGFSLRLYLRRLDQLRPIPIAHTDTAMAPFFSPDGRWVAFWVGHSLRKVPLAGGPATTLVDTAGSGPRISAGAPTATRRDARGGIWTDDDQIVFSNAKAGTIAQVAAAGGPVKVLFRDSTAFVGRPILLPDGRGILFPHCRTATRCDSAELLHLDLRTGRTRTVLSGEDVVDGAWLPSGHLAYLRADGNLVAVRFDLEKLAPVGEPVPILDQVSAFSASANGVLAAIQMPTTEVAQLSLVARDGAERPLTAQRRSYLFPAVAPDGRRLAMEIHQTTAEGTTGQVWVYDLVSSTLTRLAAPGHNSRTAWMPGGREVAYYSARGDQSGIYATAATGAGPERLLLAVRGPIAYGPVFDVTPDGRTIVYASEGDLFVASAGAGAATPTRLTNTPAVETRPRLSRDGRWLAYVSNESGRPEVYVRAFPGEEAVRLKVSEGGATEPEWGPGRELFFRGQDGWLYQADLQLDREPRVAARRRLFDASEYSSFGDFSYAAFPDGQRFAFIRRPPASPEIVVTINWRPPEAAPAGTAAIEPR